MIRENVARTIRQYKEDRGLTMEELSKELGIAKSSLGNYMNGTVSIRSDTLELLSQKSGMSIIEIISDPLPGWEQTETIARMAKELSDLPAERREEALRLFLALVDVFKEV